MADPTPDTIRRMLVLAREDARMSQQRLAKLAGTSQPAVAAFEVGTRNAGPELLARLFDAVGLRPSVPLALHAEEVLRLAREHGLGDVRVVGSIARGDDGRDSDVDLLATTTSADVDILAALAVVPRLTALLGFPVDLRIEAAPIDAPRGKPDAPVADRAPDAPADPDAPSDPAVPAADRAPDAPADPDAPSDPAAPSASTEPTGSAGPAIPLAPDFTPRPRAERTVPSGALQQLAELRSLLQRLDDVTEDQLRRRDGAVSLRVEATLSRLKDALTRLPAPTPGSPLAEVPADVLDGLAAARAALRSGLAPELTMRLLARLPEAVESIESALRAPRPPGEPDSS